MIFGRKCVRWGGLELKLSPFTFIDIELQRRVCFMCCGVRNDARSISRLTASRSITLHQTLEGIPQGIISSVAVPQGRHM